MKRILEIKEIIQRQCSQCNQKNIQKPKSRSLMQTKALVSYNSEDLSKIIMRLEDLTKQMKLNLDLSLHRDHIIDEQGPRQEAKIVFNGKVDNGRLEDFEKFKQEVQKLISDSEHSVKYEVTFYDKKPVLSLKEEEEANQKLAENHEKMRDTLRGIEKPMIRMTSKRTYSSKDGEKFSGNLYIGGNCPSDLKENFIKYYNEVAKPMPESFIRKNEAKLKHEPLKPLVSCIICQANLENRESFFSCKLCEKEKKNDSIICEECVNKENGMTNITHPHPIVLLPKRNDFKLTKSASSTGSPSRASPHGILSHWRDFDREFDDWDYLSRGILSASEPLNRRFREFERIADRLERGLRSSFTRPTSLLDDIIFPFERHGADYF